MKLRFNQTQAGVAEWYPLGCIITVDRPSPEQQRWIADGTLSVVREPSAIEVPEREAALERAGVPFVRRQCPTGIAVCLGGGPSLTHEDVEFVKGKATIIAINDAVRLAPWADYLYAADAAWWRKHWADVRDLPIQKVSIHGTDGQFPDGFTGIRLKNTGVAGLEPESTGLRTGANSGFQAVNLAVHLGAKRILLLGYDMGHDKGQPSHWFGEHPKELNRNSPYGMFRDHFKTIMEPLQRLGIEIVNCSRQTRLECVQRAPLSDALFCLEKAVA